MFHQSSFSIWSVCSLLACQSVTAASVPKPLLHDRVTIAEIQQGYANGSFTVTNVTKFYLDRIALYDKAGPKINSVIETDPDWTKGASSMDAKLAICRKAGSLGNIRSCITKLGPLFGIVTLVKDNIATLGKMQTCAGSLALVGSIVPDDAGVVKRLKAAGALILGKTGMTEWANYRSALFAMPDGWSARGGQVLNPHDTSNPDVGGSSSGCGASMAAHFATICIGSETYGSITAPAFSNYVYGLKPTPKTIPQDGIIPLTADQDVAGPLGRSMNDVSLVYSVLAAKAVPVCTKKLRVGFTKYIDSDVLQVLRKITDIQLVDMRAVSLDQSDVENIIDPHYQCRFGEDMKDYLSKLKNTTMRTMKDLVDFNIKNAVAEKIEEYGQEMFLYALTAPTYKTNATYCANLFMQYRKAGLSSPVYGWNTNFAKYKMDIIVGGVTDFWGVVGLASLAGNPAASYPVGKLNVVATAFNGREDYLVQFGKLLEKVGTRPIPVL